ncbi:2-hydroxyacid dehydrogenase [Sphingomonas sp.]|uniref:2-hydroxyacid dehydrogenase n=1 Tax=Sphingomonas sp. TaxID=28214 RepID=UPI003B3BA8AE
MARPDILLLPGGASPALTAELERRFAVHQAPGDAGPRIRAIVGGGSSVVDAGLIAALPALEIIAINGVGHDGIDLAAAKARGIPVTITRGVLDDDVADLAIALMLSVSRRIAVNDRAIRDGGWQAPLSRRLSGRRIGLYGMGAIGRAIARRADPFAGEILYTSRAAKPDLPWRHVPDLAALAEASDVLVVIVPATPETAGTVDAAILDRLGPDGILVNVARGAIVDEPALIRALAEGRIAGAGLDVFADEPHVPDALRAMEQVVLSPHQGSATIETRAAMADLVLANLDAHFAGRPLLTPL